MHVDNFGQKEPRDIVASAETKSSIALTTSVGSALKLLARIEKASCSPSAVLTYPANVRTCDIEPVLAWALPAEAVSPNLFLSVPSSLAMGSVAKKKVWSDSF